MTEIFDHLAGQEPGRADGRFHGVAIGIVTNNRDPDGLGRVKVALPWLADDAETDWARVAVPMAGAGRGFSFLPEVDDEVLVAFEHGNPEVPYVVGALWNGKDRPPVTNGDGRNDTRAITSRSGHVIRLVDTDRDERIEIVDRSAGNSIVISTKDNRITITATADVVISAGGKLRLSGNGVEITSKADVNVEAKSALAVKSGGRLAIKGSQVNIN
ncbi:phage baseplate assembly protein V [Streptomyces sp. ADMS]|uniref:phage baseplate assembly protein V n=1 Tax=Streptomyces sp. ADMS TaxID=3071415 RepID=UPI00296E8908|nr:phage baseplate assembly protein V [Streptomyces sp. ADMS]MDW4909511.1 phage baseplate assembly protein V [Streptomyces sp. ADMS]